jgi:UDP-N-acetylmuramoyl-tripeptide--D-alanyl-D-alanine ligase
MDTHTPLRKFIYLFVARYFRFWATFVLRRWRPRVIAVTGSVGKTTMLDLLEVELGSKAHYSHNANSVFGVFFDVLGLPGVTASKLHWVKLFILAPVRACYYRRPERMYVVEIDASSPDEAKFIASRLRPDITLWVSLGLSHPVFFEQWLRAGRFSDIDDAITYEFAQVARYTTGTVYIDVDNVRMVSATESIDAAVRPVSRAGVLAYHVTPQQTRFETASGEYVFAAPMPRDLSIQIVMLEALMHELKLPIVHDMSSLRLPPGRNSFIRGRDGLRIIDSSYNAHLISMQSILGMAREIRARSKWLVIGDMVEQGRQEASVHTQLGDLIVSADPTAVVLIGRRVKRYTYPVVKAAGLPVKAFDDVKSALKYLDRELTGSEVVVFKGSQYLEWLIEQLLADPADVKLLARQEPAARARRAAKGLS